MPTELAQAYQLIAELLSYPEDLDPEALQSLTQEALPSLAPVNPEAAQLIGAFVAALSTITPEYYIETFELAPKCPLYLGCYGFEEPTSCVAAGASDRNQYLLELANFYRHFGFSLGGKELPDFLPAVTEFLWLSLGRGDEGLRAEFISEYLLPYLPKLAERLTDLDSPYAKLINALLLLMNWETGSNKEVASHA